MVRSNKKKEKVAKISELGNQTRDAMQNFSESLSQALMLEPELSKFDAATEAWLSDQVDMKD